MQDSPGIPVITEEKVNELKTLALNRIDSMQASESLTEKQKEALAKDAVIFAFTKHTKPADAQDIHKTILLRITKTLHGVTRLSNRHNECRATRKGPTNKEQLERHADLLKTIDEVKKNPDLKPLIISQTTGLLEKTYSPDDKNADICANFLYHALTNKTLFNENHIVAVFENVYMNKQTTGTDETFLSQAKQIFTNNAHTLFNSFLASPNVVEPNKTSPNYKNLIPETYIDDIITNWEIVLIRHGNINARNRILLKMRKYIERYIRKYTTKIRYNTVNNIEDLYQAVSEKVMEKLIMIDVKKGKGLTYVHHFLIHLLKRELYKMSVIRQPAYVHVKRETETKYNVAERNAPQRIRFVNANRMVGEKKDIPILDIFPETQIQETPETIFIERDLTNRISKVLDQLSPRDKELITLRANGVTMQVIADKWGVTRQNIDRIEKSLMKNLLNVRFRKFRADLD